MIEPNIILGEFIINMKDRQRESVTDSADEIPNIAEKLVNSAARFDIPVYVLTNAPSVTPTNNLHVYHQDFQEGYRDLDLYFQRIRMAYDFLVDHPEVEKVAMTDVPDVTLLNYPFDEIEEKKLYMNDETDDLATKIINLDHKPDYMEDFFLQFTGYQLLNPGVMAGTRASLLEFLGIMVRLIDRSELDKLHNDGKQALGNFEMALVNYVAYHWFKTRLVHGRQVSTVFFFNQSKSSSWFKHK